MPKAAKKKATVKKGPRQDQLPGMKDRKLSALHDAALSYAEIRDQRQALTKKEVELQGTLLALMHKAKREHYEYAGVVCDLVVEKEKVKVRVQKGKADDEPEEVTETTEQEPDESELEGVESEEEFDPEEAEEELAEVEG